MKQLLNMLAIFTVAFVATLGAIHVGVTTLIATDGPDRLSVCEDARVKWTRYAMEHCEAQVDDNDVVWACPGGLHRTAVGEIPVTWEKQVCRGKL